MAKLLPSTDKAEKALEVIELIVEENEGVGSYNCPLCGGEIFSIVNHDPACQYAEYLREFHPTSN